MLGLITTNKANNSTNLLVPLSILIFGYMFHQALSRNVPMIYTCKSSCQII
jgi:hypothetical protein